MDHGARTRPLNKADSKTQRLIVTEPSSRDQQQRTVKWEYSALTREIGHQAHATNYVDRYWHRTGSSLHQSTHNRDSRSGRPVTGTRQSDNPAATIGQRVRSQELDNTHALRPTDPELRCVKASVLHTEAPSLTWRCKWKHDTKLFSTHKTGDQQSQPEWSRAAHKSVKCMPSAKAGSHSYRTGTRVRAAR